MRNVLVVVGIIAIFVFGLHVIFPYGLPAEPDYPEGDTGVTNPRYVHMSLAETWARVLGGTLLCASGFAIILKLSEAHDDKKEIEYLHGILLQKKGRGQ